MQRVSENVYVDTGYSGCNVGFVVTQDGVVLIDTPQRPSEALKWREAIAPFGEIKYLINTEPHRDHFTGNHFFGGVVISHEGVRKVMLRTSLNELKSSQEIRFPADRNLLDGFTIRPPTVTFSERLTFLLGHHTFELIHMPGHTRYQLAVHIPEEKVVFTSDNVFGRVQAWLHESIPSSWLKSLKRLEDLDATVYVPGHGSVCNKQYLSEMAEFIQSWIDAVRSAIDIGLSVNEAEKQISFLARYPMAPGTEALGAEVQKMNVARLYHVLSRKKRPGRH